MVVGASLEHHGRNNNSTGSIMEVWYGSRPTTVTVYGVVALGFYTWQYVATAEAVFT